MNQDILQSPHSSNRRRWRWPLAAVLLCGAAAGGWVMTHPQNSTAAANQAEKSEKKTEIFELGEGDSSLVEERALQVNLPVHGSLVPTAQATIKSKVAGTVQNTNVSEGMAVKAGQVLAQIDAADLQARVATQQAALDEAMARLSLAKKNNANNQALLKQNYISQNAYDTTQNSLELANASVKSAKAQLDIARLALADSAIRAPFDGIISKRFMQTGDKASPDMPLFTLVNLNKMTLEAMVPSSDISRVKVGQEVNIQIDGMQERRWQGKVERINPSAEAGSRSLLVYVQIENDGSLKGGMYAKGTIALEKSRPMPLVPILALRQENGRDVLYRVQDGKVVSAPVKLGLRNEDEGMVEISEGISTGSHVLITNFDNIKPGSKVKLPASKKLDQASPAVKKG